ncbi:MAG: shikimate dehydrogenase [Propionibacteriaceae bacterium]|jgi:shikimate dehydrogenase|nr:shikimate dehydrogenase [Propionibacteriaceae bacterium]
MLRYGVVGWPVSHSLSPALHRCGYRALGLERDRTFTICEVPPGGLANFIAGLDNQWRGLAVTMPHKEAALAAGKPDAAALQIHAGNTVVFRPTGTFVYNTDVCGVVRALQAHGVTEVTQAAVVGAGATSRAVIAGLLRIGLRRLTVLARNVARAGATVALAEQLGIDTQLAPIGAHPPVGLLVSTLPGAAVTPYVAELVARADAVFDVAYEPWERPLLAAARALGIPAIDGLSLLAGQAVDQFRLLTGYEVEFNLLYQAGLAEISLTQ